MQKFCKKGTLCNTVFFLGGGGEIMIIAESINSGEHKTSETLSYPVVIIFPPPSLILQG